jgi:hypothetical protein
LPGITDSAESIEAVAVAAKAHGAVAFGSSVLRLAPLVKEHYLGFVANTFPELLARYEGAYPGTAAPFDYQTAIERRMTQISQRHRFTDDAMGHRRLAPRSDAAPGRAASKRPGQLALPL